MANFRKFLKEIAFSLFRWLLSLPGKAAAPEALPVVSAEAPECEKPVENIPLPEARGPAEEPAPVASKSLLSPVRFFTVVLDPGHHAGITNKSPDSSYLEWSGNWDMSERVRSLLEAAGFEVIVTIAWPGAMTQKRETDADFKTRAGSALAAGMAEGAVLLSIHSNAAGKKNDAGWGDAEGMEMFVRGSDEGSKEFARCLLYGLLDGVPGLKDRTRGVGYKLGNYAILRHSNPVPAVLLEVDFHDNPEGLARLKDNRFRQLFAEGVAKGVLLLNSVYEKRRF